MSSTVVTWIVIGAIVLLVIGLAGKLVTALEQALRPSQGGRCNVAIRYATGDAAAILQFGEQWKVRPSRELIERLGSLVGRDGVELYYAPRDT